MSLKPLLRETLRRSFPEWPKPVIETLCGVGRIRHMTKGNYVARMGAPCKEIIVVLLGSVRVIGQSPDGREFTFAYLEPGHWIGLVPLTDGQGMMADYLCHEDSTFALLPNDLILEILRTEPRVTFDLLALVCARLRRGHRALEAQSLLTPAQRLAARLLAMGKLYGQSTSKGIEIALKLSQEDLATMIGVSRPTVAKELSAFVEAGVLRKLAYRRLLIVDSDALMAIAFKARPPRR